MVDSWCKPDATVPSPDLRAGDEPRRAACFVSRIRSEQCRKDKTHPAKRFPNFALDSRIDCNEKIFMARMLSPMAARTELAGLLKELDRVRDLLQGGGEEKGLVADVTRAQARILYTRIRQHCRE